MKISLFQGILFGVLSLAALIGLFVFSTFTGSNKGSTIGAVVIWGTLPHDGIQATLTLMTQSDSTLKSVTYVEKNPTTLASDLASAIATGSGPDLVLSSQEELLSLARFISPIPTSSISVRTFTDTYVEEGNLFATPGGTGYYGVPFLVDPLVLFSNRAILSSDGIAIPPATWEALTGLTSKVAVLTANRQITRGLIALGTYDNVHNARGILSTLFLQTGVPLSQYTNGGGMRANLGLSSNNGVPAGKSVLGFYTQFADPSKVSYTWNASLPDSEQMFLSGDLALYLGYASRARYLRAASPNLDFDVSVVPQPATATLRSVYGLVYALSIPTGSKNPTGALTVALAFSGAAAQAAAAANTGLAPATRAVLASAPSDPIAAVAYGEALYAQGWLSPSAQSTDQVFSGMIGNVISGRSSLDTALTSAEQSLSALLQQ